MAWFTALLSCVAAGWFLTRLLTAGTWAAPRWTNALVEGALAVLIGPGLASIWYFAMVTAGAGSAAKVFAAALIYAAICGGLWWKLTPVVTPAPAPARKIPWIWALWICAAVGFIFFFLDYQTASSANPNGEWDAISIWNLRARYLFAGGELWRRAFSVAMGGGAIGAAHPGYPLFLSGFIGLQWSADGMAESLVPVVASLLTAAAALLLLGSSLMCRKSQALGLLAWSVLLASEIFASQTAAQYSDLLQSLAFLSTLVLLDAAAERREDAARILIAAGLAIGLSAWIKNEGIPFAVAALAVGLWRFRPRGFAWLALGAAPGLLATAILKLFIAQGHESVLPSTIGEVTTKIAGAGRWWEAALGFGKAVFDAGNPWTHPVVLMIVLALALRFVPSVDRRAWLWIPIAITAAAEYGLYLVTTVDLNWHVSTSVSRLVAQLWPSLIWLVFLMLRPPEEYFEVAPAPAVQTKAKAKRR